MNFALLGDHEDGLAMARALAESGRHQLLYYAGPGAGKELLERWNLLPQIAHDIEEVLANPAVEAVIVAVGPTSRPALLRRALQAERHVLCVHPADHRPDMAYEAASIQRETNCVLLPLLPEAFHPGLEQLARLIAQERADSQPENAPQSRSQAGAWERGKAGAWERNEGAVSDVSATPGLPRLIQVERWSSEAILYDAGIPGHNPGFPGWDMLRTLAGEIVEVSAFAHFEDVNPADPVLLSGRFEKGGLFQVVLIPNQPEPYFRLRVLLRFQQGELVFQEGLPGPAQLTWFDENGKRLEQTWNEWNPWQHLVEVFEARLEYQQRQKPTADKNPKPGSLVQGILSWEDEIRCLELDDAARRSIERRRSSKLEYQEDVEEASFKGTMTLAGCGLIWISLFLLILSIWIPQLGWLIAPLFGFFLILQMLRWIIPRKPPSSPPLV